MAQRNVKNLRIMRTLLSKPDGILTKYGIAKIAGCSSPWVIEFLKKLEGLNLVSGTKILKRERFIDHYLSIMPKMRRMEGFVKDPEEFFRGSGLSYALTTYAAENYTSHHLFLTRYDAYILGKDEEQWKSLILESGLYGKGNIRLMVAYDEAILKETVKIKGKTIVSTPQLLIDLKREGGVAIEGYKLLVKDDV
jgi:hypothetical protein